MTAKGFIYDTLRGLAPNLANKSQIEYSAGMFVSRQ
jgi:hypothetical protein